MASRQYQRVKAMMQAFGQATPVSVQKEIAPQILKLRQSLNQEEANEVDEAFHAFDGSDKAYWHLVKELVDLLVVTKGALITLGVDDEWASSYVDFNNLLKIGYPKNEIGKVIKPDDHPKVDFTKPLDKELVQKAIGNLYKCGILTNTFFDENCVNGS